MAIKKTTLQAVTLNKGIASGYSFRGKISEIEGGDLRVIQLKDMENDYTSIGDQCVLVSGSSIKSKYHLESGDILFISKGVNNTAVVFRPKDEIPTVASAVFYVIKVNPDIANPDYVAWYINQRQSQQHFKSQALGTYSLSIHKEAIEEMPLRLPPVLKQEKIARVAQLSLKEQYLYNQLKEKRTQIAEAQLLSIIN